jgi:UDP-N-acetylmuramate dehydrogenase
MMRGTWKQRLIRFAHAGADYGLPMRTHWELPKTVLGRKIVPRKHMNQNPDWLHTIKGEVKYNELLADHTSFKIGGPADIFISPASIEDLRLVFKRAGEKYPVFVLGEGTNLLVRDGGVRGIVLCVRESFRCIRDVTPSFGGGETAVIRAGAGVKMSYLAKYAARYSLAGIEGLVGIPGSLGGALVMNAGAEGTEIGAVVKSVTRVNRAGEIETLGRDDIRFQYRKTVFPPGGGVIVEAEIELRRGDRVAIQDAMDRCLRRRKETQPLSLPNSGSIFKNPPGDKAGRLIEAAGLKGYRVGDAAVSTKHANFIVNRGHALASDVIGLIERIRKTVREKTGVELETEIVIVGV